MENEHEEAIKMLRAASLSEDEKQDLFAQYREDVEEYSEYTALEKLQTAISDQTGEDSHAA